MLWQFCNKLVKSKQIYPASSKNSFYIKASIKKLKSPFISLFAITSSEFVGASIIILIISMSIDSFKNCLSFKVLDSDIFKNLKTSINIAENESNSLFILLYNFFII